MARKPLPPSPKERLETYLASIPRPRRYLRPTWATKHARTVRAYTQMTRKA